jgi:hypothetical protein
MNARDLRVKCVRAVLGKNVVFGPNIWPTLEPWVLRVATGGRRVGGQFSNQYVVWRVHDGFNNVDKCGTMF